MDHQACNDTTPARKAPQAAIGQVLIEALPYIRKFEGKTFVIKYGGSAMKDECLKNSFAQNVTLLRKVGINVVLVHGGGDAITKTAEKMGIKSTFVHGKRVTDSDMITIVQMTLAGKVNQDIVRLISEHGGKAVGVSGLDADTIQALPCHNAETLGLVGEVAAINTAYINLLCNAGLIPVIAPIGFDDEGHVYNINADDAASSIAIALKAEKLIYVSDVAGIQAHDAILRTISKTQAADFIEQHVITGGMIPKVISAFQTLDGGVGKIHLIDGKCIHSILLEIFTHEGVGTQFIAEQGNDDNQ
ncbi:acetylglutamate kinase [Chlorobium phaeovibrioides]|uniref:Acetylglutamate kinase n=1 Tax=Chlorobium phaeovibrioides TaxID=1094 RepID=A0A432AY20_CHLPH|nr:acetylglutamate kinase [Chlorobium phaeovibrioides]MWV54269.1 acetylglutamate kinase [Chlorobium phaeovibrioides]QEQ57022.1 acetylglutamate kinase [Chlorobium phaeovibrioides]RTY34981.1 acetylglutamate kinase [Chlorobium phaeovibrioides]RTY39988.1 acetylglutamate kinase [Chlorobium phaeovibrioides]